MLKEKMFDALKSRYSNLGHSDETLNSVASMAIIGLAEDADDAAIAARASESSVSDMLKTLQSQFDKARGEAKKVTPKEPEGGKHEPTGDGKLDEVLSLLKSQKAESDAIKARLEELEGVNKTKAHDELVARIGKELGMSETVLGLCKQGLSADMDENGIRDALGAKKKALIEEGIKFDDGQAGHRTETQTQAERESAAEWVKEHKVE